MGKNRIGAVDGKVLPVPRRHRRPDKSRRHQHSSFVLLKLGLFFESPRPAENNNNNNNSGEKIVDHLVGTARARAVVYNTTTSRLPLSVGRVVESRAKQKKSFKNERLYTYIVYRRRCVQQTTSSSSYMTYCFGRFVFNCDRTEWKRSHYFIMYDLFSTKLLLLYTVYSCARVVREYKNRFFFFLLNSRKSFSPLFLEIFARTGKHFQLNNVRARSHTHTSIYIYTRKKISRYSFIFFCTILYIYMYTRYTTHF